MQFGPLWVICLVAIATVSAGVVSIRAERALPFWQCVASFVILPYFYLPPAPLGDAPPHNSEAILGATLLSVGAMLAIVAVRRGHWSTRTLASVSLTGYLFLLYNVGRNSIADWDTIVQYWSSQ